MQGLTLAPALYSPLLGRKYMNEEQKKSHDIFVEIGEKAGFTKNQLDFMWNFIMMSMIEIVKIK